MRLDTLFAAAVALMLGSCVALALGGSDWFWAVLGAALIAATGLAWLSLTE
jgi:hypothetical protein